MKDETEKIEELVGKPYGHVRGHTFIDARLVVHAQDAFGHSLATLSVTWGSWPEEHGREEYARRAATGPEAVELVRDAALREQKGESRRYVEMAAARALQRIAERTKKVG